LKKHRTHYERGLKIIEGPADEGMNVVGDLFGSGEDVPAPGRKKRPCHEEGRCPLLPYIERKTKENPMVSTSAGKNLLATV